jgi:hypothetical protein
MKRSTKAIYLNVGILVVLLVELYLGRPIYVVGISAVLLFVVANVALSTASRK